MTQANEAILIVIESLNNIFLKTLQSRKFYMKFTISINHECFLLDFGGSFINCSQSKSFLFLGESKEFYSSKSLIEVAGLFLNREYL